MDPDLLRELLGLLALADAPPEPVTPAQVLKAARLLGGLYPEVSYLGVVR